MSTWPLLIVVLLLSGSAGAESRVWTARTGSTLEAEWTGEEAGKVLLRKEDGKVLGIALSALSDADQAYVHSKRPAEPATPGGLAAAAASSNLMALSGVDVKRGEMITFLAPLPSNAVKALKKENNTVVAEARVGVAVPTQFDPTQPQRVLVVSATSDGNSSSLGHANQYLKEALARGWVVMAADAPNEEAPKEISNMWRWGLIQAGLQEMHRAWPGSRTWSYAAAGFSGGAKRSGYIGALLAEADYAVIGMFMGGCNQDMASKGLQVFGPRKSTFLKVPVFISNGTEDKTSTVRHAENVRNSLRGTGFKEVRLETYAGGHDPHAPHTDAALAWFEQIAAERARP
jgi:pimeloyl-ACP methyl ester carboxylesterase